MNENETTARGADRPSALRAYNRENYGEIIRQARVARGLQQQQLSAMLDMSRNTVSNWEAGRARPDINLIPDLCRILGISIPEFFGEAPDGAVTEEERELLENYAALTPVNRAIVDGTIETMLRVQREHDDAIEAPVELKRVWWNEEPASAGTGYTLGESAGRQVYLRMTPLTRKADEVITVSGDSMEPTFYNGQRVLVQHAPYVRPGEIGVFIDGNEGLIKEYRRDGLHSHNPRYKTRRFSEFSDVRCIGRVLGLLEPGMYASPEEIDAYESAM